MHKSFFESVRVPMASVNDGICEGTGEDKLEGKCIGESDEILSKTEGNTEDKSARGHTRTTKQKGRKWQEKWNWIGIGKAEHKDICGNLSNNYKNIWMRMSEICIGTEWQNMEVMMKNRSSLTLYNTL